MRWRSSRNSQERDLNDEPADASVVVHANASRERADLENATSARFYNLAWNYMRQEVTSRSGKKRILCGTLYRSGNGNLFDQILVSRALLTHQSRLSVQEHSARIEAFPEMVHDSKNEGPIRFDLPKGDAAMNVNQNGFSDHFPVSVLIDEIQ
jgi:hypothetical protein